MNEVQHLQKEIESLKRSLRSAIEERDEFRERMLQAEELRREADGVSVIAGEWSVHDQATFYRDQRVHLPALEREVLSLLLRRAGKVVTREMLLDQVYQGRDEAEMKIFDVLVCKIRKKLRLIAGNDEVLQTVWGRGWRWGNTPPQAVVVKDGIIGERLGLTI